MKQNSELNLGSVQVHKKVLAEIVSSAMREVDGVRLVQPHWVEKILGIMGNNHFPGIKVKVEENDQVTLEVKVFVRYGLNIPDIARQIQDTIKSVINKTVDINLKEVNINVQGIERGAES